MKKIIVMLKDKLSDKNENGFSLLELVVAIGILLVLTVGGLIGYSQITKNARTAAVEKAASEVMTAAMVELNGGNYTAEDIEAVADKWNGSSTGDSITVESELRSPNGEDCVFVSAFDDKDYSTEKTNCGSGSDGSTGGESGSDGSDGSTGGESGSDGSDGSTGGESGSDGSDGSTGGDDEQSSTEYVHRPVDVNAPAGMALECRQSITERFPGMYRQIVEVRAVGGDWDEGVQFTPAPMAPIPDRLNVEFEYNGAEYSIDMNGDTSNPLCSATFVKMK